MDLSISYNLYKVYLLEIIMKKKYIIKLLFKKNIIKSRTNSLILGLILSENSYILCLSVILHTNYMIKKFL